MMIRFSIYFLRDTTQFMPLIWQAGCIITCSANHVTAQVYWGEPKQEYREEKKSRYDLLDAARSFLRSYLLYFIPRAFELMLVILEVCKNVYKAAKSPLNMFKVLL